MTDLHDVAWFCLFYSAIVLTALWMTVAGSPARVEVRNKSRFR